MKNQELSRGPLMTLSKQVQDSLDDAVESLRNALSFAARSEEPYVSKHIADVMFQIENLKNVSNVLAISEKIMKDLEDQN
tara:strand:- start:1283 stop:1522 length:240 start_codon:yes stop_codon:yes gene_type:complete